MPDLIFRKASRSAGNGACVEVAWRKSSLSEAVANCVEVADTGDPVYTRDSKDAAGPVLRFPRSAWRAFIAGIQTGDIRP